MENHHLRLLYLRVLDIYYMRLLRHLRHLRHLRVLDQPDFRVSFYFFFVYLAETQCLKSLLCGILVRWTFLTHCVSPRKWKTIFPYICELHNNEVPFFMRDGLLIVLFCQFLVMIFHFSGFKQSKLLHRSLAWP